MKKILVYVATGEQASPILPLLKLTDNKVFALTRNKARASIEESKNVQLVEANLSDVQNLLNVTEGMDIIMLNLPFFSDDNAGAHAIEAAKKASVKLIVWNANGEVPQATSDRLKMNIRLENMERLVASGIPYVVFQPTVYLENLLMKQTAKTIREESRIEMVAPPDAVLPWISTQDISACMVNAIYQPETHNKVFTAKGSGWSGQQLAETFSKVLGRKIIYRKVELDTYVKKINMVMGEGHGEEIMGLSPKKDNRPPRKAVFPNFSALDAFQELKIQPITLEEWVTQHKKTFK